MIAHDSPEYWATVELRRAVLRWPLGLDFTDDQLAAESADFHIAGLVVNRVVACLVLSPVREGVLKMRQVAVLPPLQGGGIGGALVRFAESFAVSHGIVRFELSARETAVPFYLNLGYEMVGEPYEEVTLPHRSLVKNLS